MAKSRLTATLGESFHPTPFVRLANLLLDVNEAGVKPRTIPEQESSRTAQSDVCLTSRAPDVPAQRFTAVTNGQQRSAAVTPDLRQHPSKGGGKELPKLAEHPSSGTWKRTSRLTA